jgi:hypothetical protein
MPMAEDRDTHKRLLRCSPWLSSLVSRVSKPKLDYTRSRKVRRRDSIPPGTCVKVTPSIG